MREKILVVEDDGDLRDAICETLKLEGFPAEGVANVAGAETMLTERGPYRAALVDLTLEDGDGAVLAQTLRSKHRMPVILMTGDNTNTAHHRPGLQYVRKPFDIDDLITTLVETVRARAPRGG